MMKNQIEKKEGTVLMYGLRILRHGVRAGISEGFVASG